DPASSSQMANELVEAKENLVTGRSAFQEIRRLEAEESSAKRALEGAAQRLKQWRDVTCRIDANRLDESAQAKSLLEQQAREQEGRAALARTQEQIAGIDQQTQALSIRSQQLEKLYSAIIRAARKDDLARQLI